MVDEDIARVVVSAAVVKLQCLIADIKRIVGLEGDAGSRSGIFRGSSETLSRLGMGNNGDIRRRTEQICA